MKWILSLLFLPLWAQEKFEDTTRFDGLVSVVNSKASLLRIRVEAENLKYLRTGDEVVFWQANRPAMRCRAQLRAQGPRYILLEVPEFNRCQSQVLFAVGSKLYFDSQDLENNLATGKELIDILLKKRMAMEAKAHRSEKILKTYPERIEAVNKRYEVLRQKLELEWGRELSALEADRLKIYEELKQAESLLKNIDEKLEIYRIHDPTPKMDRWSLDPKLHLLYQPKL